MAGFAYYAIQRNDTTNDSIFHMSDGILFLVSWVRETGPNTKFNTNVTFRMQKLEESSAIELAKEMMGITDSTDSSGLNFNPQTQEEFNELRDTSFCLNWV